MTTMITARGFPIQVGDHGLSYYRSLVSSVQNARYISNTLTNTDRINALISLKDLFGLDYPQTQSLKSWFLSLLNDKSLPMDRLMLIKDTLKYIKTGMRNTPLAVYDTILKEVHEDGVTKKSEMVTFDIEQRRLHGKMIQECRDLLEEYTQGGLFVQWVKTDEGFMDFVSFIEVIIGRKD